MKRGEMRYFLVLLTIVILGMFTYMTMPLKFSSGPTGLAFSAQANIAGCAVINSTSILTQDIVGTGTCITIANNSVDFSCGGFTILFDTSGGNLFGIDVEGVSNFAIRDCTIVDGSVASTSSRNIRIRNATDGLITNSTIISNQSIAIRMQNISNITIESSVIIVHSTTSTDAIVVQQDGFNITIKNNIISSRDVAIDLNNRVNGSIIINNIINTTDSGVEIGGRGNNNNITNNTMIINTSTGSGEGLLISSGNHDNYFMYNLVNITTSSSNKGVHGQSDSDNLTIIGNTFFLNCTGSSQCRGVFFESNFDNSTVANNMITVIGSSSTRGIHFTSNVHGVNVTNNTIIVNGTSSSNAGIFLQSNTLDNILDFNTITLEAGSNSQGIVLESNSHNNTGRSNTINFLGTGFFGNAGLELTSSSENNTFFGTVVNSIATSGNVSGILVDADDNAFHGSNVTNFALNDGFAVSVERFANRTIFNNTFITAPDQWLEVTEADSIANFTDTTFNDTNGSINFPGTFVIDSAILNITDEKLNISFNSAFVNTTNISVLNISARITLKDITLASPEPIVDFDDDGTFESCPSTICTEVSFGAGTYVYDVTQFTAFSSAEGDPNVTLTKSDDPDPVTAGNQLNYTIIINNTGTSNATNITLTETYPDEVIFISASPSPLAGTNTTFIIGNLSEGEAIVINITVSVTAVDAGTVLNNTVNITFVNITGGVANATVVETTTAQLAAAAVGGGGYTTPTSGGVRSPEPEYQVSVTCFESWACEGWGDCEFGYQNRVCVDLSECGTTNLKPQTTKECVSPVVERPAPAPVIEQPAPEPVVSEEIVVPEERPVALIILVVLASLAVLSLVAYIWIMHDKK